MPAQVQQTVCIWLLCVCVQAAELRVRLNPIRTVMVSEEEEPTMKNGSLGLTRFQCVNDLQCPEGRYCHAPRRGPTPSRCHTCRWRNRRCHRDGMCCPGNRCSNNVCVPLLDSVLTQAEWRRQGQNQDGASFGKGQLGASCLRSSDCSSSLCCARHFWTRICKPLLEEGQVCSQHHRRKGAGGLELFQRCSCSSGMACRVLSGASSSSSSSSPSSSLLAAARSRFTSPHISLTTSSEPRAVKTRLHICQRN